MSSSGSSPPEKGKGPSFQPNLFAFFASNVRTPPKKKPRAESTGTLVPVIDNDTVDEPVPTTSTTTVTGQVPPGDLPPPLIPVATPTPHNITWQSLKNDHILMRRPAPMLFGATRSSHNNDAARTKVATFDMDGTLFVWRCPGYPNNLSDYEVWNRSIFEKMRDLYQNQGYQLLLISNQGYIQKAHTGKTAQRIQNLINWIAAQVGCPIAAVLSTVSPKKSTTSYHKPNPQLFHVAHVTLKANWDLKESFFVGDSEDIHDRQGGVDRRFAQNVGLKFYTPDEYFGPSDAARRQAKARTNNFVPVQAQEACAALLGGYWISPILLILCGVQGSGKSTFAESLLHDNPTEFVHLCQDIMKKREKVEAATRDALASGKSVIVDRMHLTPDQRDTFISVGAEAKVPIHFVVFNPPPAVISRRVEQRTNHPGNVEGEKGAQLALRSLHNLVLPTYEEAEGISLISVASTDAEVACLVQLYTKAQFKNARDLVNSYVSLSEGCRMPRVVLGTMNVGKRVAKQTVLMAASVGFRGLDTSPTYNNEEAIGESLLNVESSVFCIGKIPRSPTWGGTAQKSLSTTLDRLQRSTVDLLLLHWPTDAFAEGRLFEIWKEMEICYREGKCQALGVCNFNAAALSELLPNVSVRPVVNQVERHPLLPQMELIDFCRRHNIHVQAHTPLGQGRDELLANDVVVSIARESDQSVANVILQWNLQQGVSVVPKCQNESHMKEVFRCKPLSSEQMKRLDALASGKRFVAPHFMFGSACYCWGP